MANRPGWRDSRVDPDSEPPAPRYDERTTPVMHEGTTSALLYAHGQDIQRVLSAVARLGTDVGKVTRDLERHKADYTGALFDLTRRFTLDDEAKERAAKELAAALKRAADRSGRLWGVISALLILILGGLGKLVWDRMMHP